MKKSREAILADVLGLLRELADDWEYTGPITEETRLFTDMGLASLDVVVLGTAIQERYEQVIPFQEFYAEIGESGAQDIPIGQWVDFIYTHVNAPASSSLELEGESS